MTTSASPDHDRPLRLHPLTYLEEGDEVTVGRADIDSYGLFPADGAALLRRLEAGDSPNAAARWYQENYGEQVDIPEFLEVLEELELLVKDGEAAPEAAAPVRWQRLGRAVFSPAAWVLCAALAVASVVEMVRVPDVAPRYQNLFFTHSSLLVLTLGIVFGQLPWILLHESAHALAGRRLGLHSRLSVTRRLYYVVFVTALDGLVAVPRRKRYLPMLAGLATDVVVIAGLTLTAAALHGSGGATHVVYRLLLTMAFGTVLRVVWQFYFFLRTDLYYLAITVLGCNDLQTTAKQMLRNRLWRLLGRTEKLTDPATWRERDAQVARWYSWLMLAGYLFLLVTLATAAVPTAIQLTELSVRKLGSDLSFANTADVLAFLVVNFWEPALAVFLAVRAWRRRSRSGRPAGHLAA